MILSRRPISYPIRQALSFPDMKIVQFTAGLLRGVMRVSATLQNHNDVTGVFDPESNSFRVVVDDLTKVAAGSLRIQNIIAELDVVVGLVYDVQFLEREIVEAERRGDDTRQLKADLQAAEDALATDP